MCYYAYKLPIQILGLFIPFGFLTILYAIPFLSGLQKSLRAISYLKIIIVAFVWAGTTVVLPIVNSGEVIDESVALYAIQRFLIVAVLILPFDIRDIQYDAISLQTIPMKIGIKNTKKLGFVLLLFALVIEFLISTQTISKNIFLGFSLITLLFLMRAEKNQSKYYSSFWVESLPVFWWLFLTSII
jgi:4-hydroxybenzoate polyprenyltransferase